MTVPGTEWVHRFRAFLDRIGYTETGLEELFRSTGVPTAGPSTIDELRKRASADTALAVTAGAFLLGDDLEEPKALHALGADDWGLLQQTGLLKSVDGRWRPQVMLRPFRHWRVASDFLRWNAVDPHMVMPAGPTAKHLYEFIIREPQTRALDLCCGCGLHAISLSQHCQQVSAADLNPRSEYFVQLNAAINGVDPIRFRRGDGYSPFGDEKFDLIVCNPPFVLSPTKEFLFRENSMNLDDFVRALVRQTPQFLAMGGMLQMILEWAELENQPWKERLAEWLSDLPVDALLLRAHSQPPERYAEVHVLETHNRLEGNFIEEKALWLEYFRRHRVSAIHGGLLALRRRDQPGWLQFESVSQDFNGEIGDFVFSKFVNQDRLSELNDLASWSDSRWQLAPELRLVQQSTVEQRAWVPYESVVSFGRGWQSPLTLDQRLVPILLQFDGRATLGEINKHFAATAGADADQTMPQMRDVVGQLVEHGVLRSAGNHVEPPTLDVFASKSDGG